jgi:4-carboxymuconolactone decarboxylase
LYEYAVQAHHPYPILLNVRPYLLSKKKQKSLKVRTLEGAMKMDKEKFEKGLAVRRAVLGDEYVNKSLANADEFSQPMQELVTEACWGTIWTRPGLPLKMRSLVNVALLAALNRPQEFKTHVRGALNNGCTAEEIQEVLLQVATYCGMPAGVDGFRNAAEIIRETKGEQQRPPIQ